MINLPPETRLAGSDIANDHGAMRPMTGVDDAERTVVQSPVSKLARPLRPYADIFRIPGARRFSAARVIGRMPMSMFGLGTVLLIVTLLATEVFPAAGVGTAALLCLAGTLWFAAERGMGPGSGGRLWRAGSR
jgi:hypothetical protein